MPEPTEHFVNVRGIRLHYLDWGGNGPPMLMLHGDMRTSRSWDAVIRDLRSQFHIISLNNRGNGDSDWTETGYRFENRVADLTAFCESLDIKNTIGVGHSTGAVVMTLVAERIPETFNRLILLEPMIVVNERFQRMVSNADRPAKTRRTWASREELHEYLKQHPATRRWRDDVIRDVTALETIELSDGSIDMKWAQATMSWKEREGDYLDLRPAFRALGVPVLFIASGDRRSAFEELDPLMAELPDFHVVTVERTGHNMYMERPDAVSRAIKDFVDGQSLPASI